RLARDRRDHGVRRRPDGVLGLGEAKGGHRAAANRGRPSHRETRTLRALPGADLDARRRAQRSPVAHQGHEDEADMSYYKGPRPDGEVRRSQLLTQAGPGALVDLVRHAVVVGGLDWWRYGREDEGYFSE